MIIKVRVFLEKILKLKAFSRWPHGVMVQSQAQKVQKVMDGSFFPHKRIDRRRVVSFGDLVKKVH